MTQPDLVEAVRTFAYWRIERPNHVPLTVLVSPSITQEEALARYPGCGVLPMSEEEVRAWRGEK